MQATNLFSRTVPCKKELIKEDIRGSKSWTKTIRSSVFRLPRQLPDCWLNPTMSAVSGGLPPIRPSTASSGYPNRLTLL